MTSKVRAASARHSDSVDDLDTTLPINVFVSLPKFSIPASDEVSGGHSRLKVTPASVRQQEKPYESPGAEQQEKPYDL
ncbi:hypothetical protein KFK09_021460 [Dendrobium nobile]|uniref:Uncharacterized protein n=1 Tax=Dendrobium nobile TaxID=94219 RepID=A0A8T3APC5_DENNO|nr:hypothetical protein KFK09_021460 [Dendrobium nobile]